MDNSMLAFLTAENIKMHEEYLKTLKLKRSIIEKSGDGIKGAGIKDIGRLKIDRELRDELYEITVDILSHELYFNSYSGKIVQYPPLKRFYSSESAFAYEIFLAAKATRSPFLYLYKGRDGKPLISDSFTTCAVLAIDLCEHAYLLDYGLAREEYIKRAIAHLDFEKLMLPPLDNIDKK